MKHSRNKQYSLRKNLKKNEINYLIVSSLLHNENINTVNRLNLLEKIQKYNKIYGNKVKIKNQDILSYRFYSVNKHTRLNRVNYKNFLEEGNLNGFKKSSW